MYKTDTIKEKIQLFIKILWPILITQIGMFAMNVFDTIMSGKAGTDDLAGVAIGANIWMPVFVGLNGVLLAVTPIVSQMLGGNRKNEITGAVTQAVYLSIVLSVIVIGFGAVFLTVILNLMDLTPEVYHIAKHYLIGLSFGIIPLFIATILRYFFDALGHTRITMFVILLSLPINFLFNYALIFGKWGLPELGGIGTGYATAITYWVILLISLAVLKIQEFKQFELFAYRIKPSIQAWKEQLSIGVPMGLSIFFEASIFAVVTLLMSQFNTTTIAAHMAAFNFTSLIFMVPLSISMALTITVGFEVGAKRIKEAVQYSKVGIGSAIGIIVVCSIGIFVFREDIARLYSDDADVIVLAQQFLIFAIFYQLSDAAQASMQGVLRGYKDVNIPFIMALISYWGLGIPAGYLLANYTALGPFGYWLGITIGLTAAAVGFAYRLAYNQKRYKREEVTE